MLLLLFLTLELLQDSIVFELGFHECVHLVLIIILDRPNFIWDCLRAFF